MTLEQTPDVVLTPEQALTVILKLVEGLNEAATHRTLWLTVQSVREVALKASRVMH